MEEEEKLKTSKKNSKRKAKNSKSKSIIERTEEILKKKQEKIKNLSTLRSQKKAEEEDKKCTFKPKTNKTSKKRTINDLYKWQREKINKRYKEAAERAKTPTKKNINKNSEKILKKSSSKKRQKNLKIEDRLLLLEAKRKARLEEIRQKEYESEMEKKTKRNYTSIRDKDSFKKNVIEDTIIGTQSFATLPKKISKKLSVGFLEKNGNIGNFKTFKGIFSEKRDNGEKMRKKKTNGSSLGNLLSFRKKERREDIDEEERFFNVEVQHLDEKIPIFKNQSERKFKEIQGNEEIEFKEEKIFFSGLKKNEQNTQKKEILNLDSIINEKLNFDVSGRKEENFGKRKRIIGGGGGKKVFVSERKRSRAKSEFNSGNEEDFGSEEMILRLEKISCGILQGDQGFNK